MPYPHPENVSAALWRATATGTPPQIFAIVDGAREDRIYSALLKSDCEYRCLYRGELEPDLAAAAPYLVRLQQASPFTTWLISQGWGDSWEIFLDSTATLDELRRHFRRFLMVYDHTGKPLYFRYYDPRVFRIYVPTCNATDLAVLFGPVGRYAVEGEDPNSLIEYRCRDGKLLQRTVALTGRPAAAAQVDAGR